MNDWPPQVDESKLLGSKQFKPLRDGFLNFMIIEI